MNSTGTFYVNNKPACRGFYGNNVVQIAANEKVMITPPTDKNWTLTEAPNGTGLRLFSVSRQEWNEMKITEHNHYNEIVEVELEPWSEFEGDFFRIGYNYYEAKYIDLPDRVWVLATYKNLDGHARRWGGKRQFGSMFEEILGYECLISILKQTCDDKLCISYFMCHRDNDINNEMGNNPSVVYQTLIWNRETMQFYGPCFQEWITPTAPIQTSMLLNPIHGTGLVVEDRRPLLYIIYDGDQLHVTKYISANDELVHAFRSKSHNKFAALWIAEQRFARDQSEEMHLQLQVAKTRLFTDEELCDYNQKIELGKIEFWSQLAQRHAGQFVQFDKDIYKHCNILKSLGPNVSRQQYQETIWNNLTRCNQPKNIGAVEAFWRLCCLAAQQ